MKTFFAPPERSSREQLHQEIISAAKMPIIKELAYILTDAFMILNKFRQIIYCNDAMVKFAQVNKPEDLFGLRPGEALRCIHSNKEKSGCGTSEFCQYCGAVNAVLKSQKENSGFKEEECRLTLDNSNQFFEILVRAKSLDFENNIFTLVVTHDISDMKRRQVLEQIFFHDILNTAGGIKGLITLIRETNKKDIDEFLKLAESSSDILIDEIHAQKDLLDAENGSLKTKLTDLNSLDILSAVYSLYLKHPNAADRHLKVNNDAVSQNFISDSRLIIRVLGNMIKNAFEAEEKGSTITLNSGVKDNFIEFSVHNKRIMSEKTKKQIFQRSFSTKGSGRGIGTYSIRILTEKYLNGKVGFTSDENIGTIFKVNFPLD